MTNEIICGDALVALKLGRGYKIIELKPEYCEMGEKRLRDDMGLFLKKED